MASPPSNKSFVAQQPSATSSSLESKTLHNQPPSAWLMALELRALWEFGALLPAWPLLARAPKGDGHAVMVFPGLSANDTSTVPLRHYLQSLNYKPSGWEQGFNFGPRAGVLDEAKANLRRTFESTAGKVSLKSLARCVYPAKSWHSTASQG